VVVDWLVSRSVKPPKIIKPSKFLNNIFIFFVFLSFGRNFVRLCPSEDTQRFVCYHYLGHLTSYYLKITHIRHFMEASIVIFLKDIFFILPKLSWNYNFSDITKNFFLDFDWRSQGWDFSRNLKPHGKADQDLYERRPRQEALLWASHPNPGKNEKIKNHQRLLTRDHRNTSEI